MKNWKPFLLGFALGMGVTICYIAYNELFSVARVIAPQGGNYAVERLVHRIETNAPIKEPILAFQSQITATTTPLVITKEKIVYVSLPNGDQSWKADLQPILAEKGIKGSGAVEFNKPASNDYYFALEVLLTGKLTAIEGADGKWWVGTDNPGITLTNYDIVKVKPKDKIIPTIAINASYSFSNDGQNNGHFGGGIIWHPWGYGLGIGGGWQQGPVAGLDWVIKQ